MGLQDQKTLKIHIESKHIEDLFKYPCGDCEFNAEGPRFLKQHQNEKHGPYKKEKTVKTENVKNHAKINENQVKPFDEHLQYNNQNDKKQKDNIEIVQDASEFPIQLVKNSKNNIYFFSYKCKPCDKSFKERDTATEHWNARHICSYCHKQFQKNTVLQDHVKKIIKIQMSMFQIVKLDR